jgi:aminoacyl tRNA synthase complex-interacting multifunctional protein 1
MSDPSISKLASPLKDLVLGATLEYGKSDKDKAEVAEWIEKVAQGDIVKPTGVMVCMRSPTAKFNNQTLSQDLNVQLVPRTYIVSNYLTAADVALYGALHPVLVC